MRIPLSESRVKQESKGVHSGGRGGIYPHAWSRRQGFRSQKSRRLQFASKSPQERSCTFPVRQPGPPVSFPVNPGYEIPSHRSRIEALHPMDARAPCLDRLVLSLFAFHASEIEYNFYSL